MENLHTLRAGLATLFAVAIIAMLPRWASAQPAPMPADVVLEATIVNNHREAIQAMVWADGVLFKLGELPDGEARTFTLPTAVRGGARYYLLSACPDGEWITSDALTGSVEREARFVVARTAQRSYVRYTPGSNADDSP